MNPINETIVSGDLFKALRESGNADDYVPVPANLEKKARQLLKGRAVADMDDDFKRKLRNRNKRMRRAGVAGY